MFVGIGDDPECWQLRSLPKWEVRFGHVVMRQNDKTDEYLSRVCCYTDQPDGDVARLYAMHSSICQYQLIYSLHCRAMHITSVLLREMQISKTASPSTMSPKSNKAPGMFRLFAVGSILTIKTFFPLCTVKSSLPMPGKTSGGLLHVNKILAQALHACLRRCNPKV